MGHHLYSCYRLRIPNKRMNFIRLWATENLPKIPSTAVLFNVYTRLKRKIEYTERCLLNDFHQATTFVTRNDTKQQIGSMKEKRSEKRKLVFLKWNAMRANEKMARDSTFDGYKCWQTPNKTVAVKSFNAFDSRFLCKCKQKSRSKRKRIEPKITGRVRKR